jgi:hypothetical protein
VAAFSFSKDESDAFTLRKSPFRMILSRAESLLTEDSDIEEIRISEAMDGLAFDLIDNDAQRARLAKVIFEATRLLKADIISGKQLEEPTLPGIEDKLDRLLDFLSVHLR